jgi:coproporphyrinogen III oxidase-like Fe-S oxidoreductase
MAASPDLLALLDSHPELRIEQDDYNINVASDFGRRLDNNEVLRRYADHPGAGAAAHLYFHVPLCSYICKFCNYVKRRLPTGDRGEEMLEQCTTWLMTESAAYLAKAPWVASARIESAYLGGGTASLLRPHQLELILNHVGSSYALSDDCEITLEGNPDNFTAQYVAAARTAGFNRFSVGVQSFSDEVTSYTGREHDSLMSIAAIDAIAATGSPFNVDLMFGLPRQTPQSVAQDIGTAIKHGAPTITIYRLRNADRQRMGIGNRAVWNLPSMRKRLHAEGAFPSLIETYAMRAAAVDVLLEHDYRPSPCGWWNAPGTYPDGNIPRVSRNKWQRYDTMIAYGPGAYGWLNNGDSVLQTHNDSDIAAYGRRQSLGDARPVAFGRLLDGVQAVSLALGFAFKANQPIELERFKSQFGVNLLGDEPYRSVFEELIAKGLIAELAGSSALHPTLEGEALHEEIITVYLHGRLGRLAEPVCRRG